LRNTVDTVVSREVIGAARRLAERKELAGASMDEIAREAGVTRMTLYRRGETRAAIIEALRSELAREQRELLLPILASEGDARTRLTRVLEGLCATTEAAADIVIGLDAATLDAIFHEEGQEALSRLEFRAPIVRLLRDGELDGSLRRFRDAEETATVLKAQVQSTFLHLRREHRWTAERAAEAVVDLAIGGLLPR
jgi:AcrR family transcriptional regulator